MSSPHAPQVFAVASPDGIAEWRAFFADVRFHEAARPSAESLAQLLRGAQEQGRGIVLVRGDRCRAHLLRADAEADVTVVVTDSAGGIGGRGAGDLAATLWREAPAVAAFLGESPLDAGAVVFSAAAVAGPLRSFAADRSGDAVGRAVAAVLAEGGTLHAVMPPLEWTVGPTDPPPLSPSGPPPGRRWLAEAIRHADPATWLGPIASPPDAAAVRAGLLLWHDFLDESHEISQSIEGEGRHAAGDYWHAIMHRRERDYGNAKYWFRRVGRHPVFAPLAERRGHRWSAAAFVDACADAEKCDDSAVDLDLRRTQADEMLLLLIQTVRDARGA